MANTFELISSVTVGSGGAASIDFTSIPATYTDLCLKVSARDTRSQTANDFSMRFNGSTSNLSSRAVFGTGSAAASGNWTTGLAGVVPSATATSNTFANIEIYIPNYAGSSYKSASIDSVMENNGTQGEDWLIAWLWSNTVAVNQITLVPNASASFVQYSTAYLYGVKNA